MKKALSITLAGMLFTIEEDAYEKLSGYLKSVQDYFGSFPDSEEIIKDIEARMAEQLIAMHENTTSVITIDNVLKLISIMGKVEDFEAQDSKDGFTKESQQESKGQNEPRGPRRLMRDPDDVVIAGVASGIAAYLDIDVLLVRITFIILMIILGGFGGVAIYIILALVIPKAKTPAEKTMMHGGPISLKSFRQNVNEMAKNVKENSSDIIGKDSNLRSFLNNFFRVLGKIIRILIKAIAFILGIAITIASAVAIAALTSGAVILMFKTNYFYPDFSILEIVPHGIYYLAIIIAYLIAMIPLALFGFLGQSLIRPNRPIIRTEILTALIVIWFIALPIEAALIANYYPEVNNHIESLPQSKKITKVLDVDSFKNIDLRGTGNISLVQGTSTSVAATGREADIDQYVFEVNNETFSDSYRSKKLCLFCVRSEAIDFLITTPNIENISLSGSVNLEADKIETNKLNLNISGIAKTNLKEVSAQTVEIEQSGSSLVNISGTAIDLKIDSSGISKFRGFDFKTENAEVEASGSSDLEIQAAQTLDVKASGISEINYVGNPKVTTDTSGEASVEKTGSR